jgi:hypothetical protein
MIMHSITLSIFLETTQSTHGKRKTKKFLRFTKDIVLSKVPELKDVYSFADSSYIASVTAVDIKKVKQDLGSQAGDCGYIVEVNLCTVNSLDMKIDSIVTNFITRDLFSYRGHKPDWRFVGPSLRQFL